MYPNSKEYWWVELDWWMEDNKGYVNYICDIQVVRY